MTIDYGSLPFDEIPPKPKATINTFRAFGYNLQTAIADIVDNSISADAQQVWIEYHWNGADSWVSITDDGKGMDLPELKEAMTPGSKDPNDVRPENDLGRFGLGLKTASFSQCKALTVLTRKKEHTLIKRSWDLDFVNETGKWCLLDYLSDEKFAEKLNQQEQGTSVLWQKLDRLVGNAHPENDVARKVFLEEFEHVDRHLGLVFHRYLEKKKLVLWMNGNKVEPWDPFMKESDGGQIVARESLENDTIQVRCYVLPHSSKLTVEQRKKARTEDWYHLQGFYVYRNNRLLLFGDWLGLFPDNEHCKNARILVDIPNSLDHEWKIDIKKATATPPVSVRKDLIRLGKLTRKEAGQLHRFRGNQLRLEGANEGLSFQPVWKARKERDDTRHYYINTEHPLIARLIEKEQVTVTELKTLLKIIGETTPVEAIIQYHSEEPESHELRDRQKEPETVTIELARQLFQALKVTGVADDIAIRQILNIEPFNLYPQLIEYLS